MKSAVRLSLCQGLTRQRADEATYSEHETSKRQYAKKKQKTKSQFNSNRKAKSKVRALQKILPSAGFFSIGGF